MTLAEKKEFAETMVALGRSTTRIIPRGAARHSTQAASVVRKTYEQWMAGFTSVLAKMDDTVPLPPSLNEMVRQGRTFIPTTTTAEAFGDAPAPPDMNAMIRAHHARRG